MCTNTVQNGWILFRDNTHCAPMSVADGQSEAVTERFVTADDAGNSIQTYAAHLYCFKSRSRIFHLYGDVTITDEGLQNSGLCSALRAFYLRNFCHMIFTVLHPAQNFSFIWRRHHCRWRAAKFRPMLGAFEQGGIFIVQHLLWHGASVFPVSSERPPNSVASYDTRGGVEDPHGYYLVFFLYNSRSCTYNTRI
jgi:hypothetical protein